jgi:hypothetical protein
MFEFKSASRHKKRELFPPKIPMSSAPGADLPTEQPWRSLFLPLQPAENVVFCSFYSRTAPLCSLTPPTTAGRQWSPETLLVLLHDASIRIYSLASDSTGPTLLQHIVHRATAAQGSSAADSPQENISMASRPGSAVGTPHATSLQTPASQKQPTVTATCGSLVPLHLVGFLSSDFFHHHQSLVPRESASPPQLLRGIVGMNNGRVEVFGRNSYIFGFKAHSCKVRAAYVIHAGDFAEAQGPENIRPRNGAGAQSESSLMTINASATSRKYLDDVCSIGFVTMGEDGHVFVWRRRNSQDGYEAALLRQPSLFSKCSAVAVVQPTWDLAHPAMEGGPVWVGVARGAASSAGSPQPQPGGPASPLPFPASLLVCGPNGYGHDISVVSLDTLKPAEPSVEVPGSFSRTSAIATEGSMILAAREKIIYAITYVPRTVQRLLTVNTTVLQLELSQPLAVAGCRSGKIVVFGATTGIVLGTYSTFSRAPVRCLSFHYHAMVLCVADDTGAAELLELPAEYLRHGSAPGGMLSAHLLQRVVQLEESSSGDGAPTTARRAIGEESLLLARLAISPSLRTYLGAQHRIL